MPTITVLLCPVLNLAFNQRTEAFLFSGAVECIASVIAKSARWLGRICPNLAKYA